MKKEYDTSVKEAIERVMSVFSEYIKTTPYFDIHLSAVLLVMTLLSWILQQMKSRCHPFGWHLFYHL